MIVGKDIQKDCVINVHGIVHIFVSFCTQVLVC